MSNISQSFIDQSCKYLTSNYLPKIEECIGRLSEDEVWWRPNEESNSIGNLILHLTGNVRQWVNSGIGGKDDNRVRQLEFDERTHHTADELLANLRQTVEEASAVLAEMNQFRMANKLQIQGYDVTIMEAIYHVVEHFSMHTGQIIYITKLVKGDIGFYDTSGGTPRPTWNKREK